MTDAFEEEGSAIVDCDVLEAAKENIQPLASGRRVTALSAIFSTPHAQRESRLLSARNRHRVNVEVALEDEEDDPLEAYCRFVYWTVENYPQGHSAESGLLELLEEATRVLKDNRGGTWRDDIRYLKLWVLYATYVEKPAIIYKFCMVNEIGTSHALLYEEFATVLERAGRRTEADQTYMLGIARKAAPVERLESKHKEFQKRMMSSSVTPAPSTPTEPIPAAPPGTTTRRKVLGESASLSSSRTTRTTRSASAQAASSATPPIASSSSSSRPNARLQIFVDPSGSSENLDPADSPTPWPELGTRKERVKENLREVSKAGGTTLKQSKTKTSTASKIAVFRDPEPGSESPSMAMPPPPVPTSKAKSSVSVFRDEDLAPDGSSSSVPATPKFVPFRDEEPPTPTSATVPGAVMKTKAVGSGMEGRGMSSEAEALRKDPFKNYSPDEKPEDTWD